MRPVLQIGTVGMQRGQAKMAGFGKGDGVVHRLAIADFTHQDHVGCLTQGVLQSRFPAVGVESDFALRDDAVLVRMDEFESDLRALWYWP